MTKMLKFVGCSHDGVTQTLNRLLQQDSAVAGGDAVAAITDILIGSKKIRHGGTSEEHRGLISARVQRFVQSGLPVEVFTMWGANKGYGQIADRCSVDLADILGIRRFALLNAQVRAIYSPGLRVRICCEDIGEVLLNQQPEGMEAKMASYVSGLRLLAYIMSAGAVSVHEETQILTDMEVSRCEYRANIRTYGELFEDYWWESADVPHEQRATLKLAKYLEQAGWRNGIEDVARAYYVERARNENPHMGYSALVRQVCRYLGLALARRKAHVDKGLYADAAGVIPPIRANFQPYPPGAFSSHATCRLEYKLKDSKNSHRVVTPWNGFGFTACNGGQWDVRLSGLRECETVQAIPTVVMASDGEYEQPVRADYIEP